MRKFKFTPPSLSAILWLFPSLKKCISKTAVVIILTTVVTSCYTIYNRSNQYIIYIGNKSSDGSQWGRTLKPCTKNQNGDFQCIFHNELTGQTDTTTIQIFNVKDTADADK